MTLPTTNYNPGSPVGSFDIPGGGTIAADTMVEDFIDLLKPFWKATTSFDFYEIFTKATATADSVLRYTAESGEVGTTLGTGWDKATEAVWSFKSAGNGLYKLAFLDVEGGNQWDKITFSGLTGAAAVLVTYLTGGGHGWSARDDTPPATFLQIAYGLNKALRRKYGMN